MSFDKLPWELIQHVASYVSDQDFYSLLLSNRYIYRALMIENPIYRSGRRLNHAFRRYLRLPRKKRLEMRSTQLFNNRKSFDLMVYCLDDEVIEVSVYRWEEKEGYLVATTKRRYNEKVNQLIQLCNSSKLQIENPLGDIGWCVQLEDEVYNVLYMDDCQIEDVLPYILCALYLGEGLNIKSQDLLSLFYSPVLQIVLAD